jgi:hypothetical protein
MKTSNIEVNESSKLVSSEDRGCWQLETIGETMNVDDLEQALLDAVFVNEHDSHDFQAIRYPTSAEIHFLHCQQQPLLPKEERSLLGLLDVGINRVTLQTTKATTPQDSITQRLLLGIDIPHKRLSRSWVSKSRRSNKETTTTTSSSPPTLQWIDVRCCDEDELLSTLQSSFNVYKLLQILLGTQHTASPWYDTEYGQSSIECVVLILSEANEQLLQFRVSDAAPSWYLHTILQCDSELLPQRPWERNGDENDEDSASFSSLSSCTVLVYRHLPPRNHLTREHPHTKEIAPNKTLWETIPDPTYSEEDADQTPPPPLVTRLVSQPYLDALHEYPILQLLIDNLAAIQQEALTIQHWTAWPEETHYSKLNNLSGSSTPWTVFPLCHCFPATNALNLQWIPPTTALLPATTRLLHQLQPYLRTALFSRLEPQALLQAHTGWEDLANHVVRVHLPLICPPDNVCGLWVDGCVEPLKEGQLVCFDDSKVHWAYNYSPTRERIVLILDMVRPEGIPKGTAIGGHSEELDAFIESMGGRSG